MSRGSWWLDLKKLEKIVSSIIDKIILLGTTYIRDAVCIGFCVNELLSIVENSSLMGTPYPKPILKAIDVLQKKAGRAEDETFEVMEKTLKEDDENGSKDV